MVKLTQHDVRKLAELARLEISKEEVLEFTKEFNELLTYVKQLDDIDTEGLEPTVQVSGLSNKTRIDEIVDYNTSAKQLLENAPRLEKNMVKVNRMVG